MKKVGIYCIKNIENNKKYIGLSSDVEFRLLCHKRRLRSGKHRNKHLQSSFNKYKESSFDFCIIEECLEDELLDKEKYWIKEKNSYDREHGYNKTFGGEFGRLHPDIYKRYSERLKGGHISEEQKKQISKTLTGRKQPIEDVEKRAKSNRKLDDKTENEIIDLFKYGFGYVVISKMMNIKDTLCRSVIVRFRRETKNGHRSKN